MNILYLGSPDSVHDIKWITFFSESVDYKVFLITEECRGKVLSEEAKEELKKKKINFAGEITPYSILKPLQIIRSIRFLKRFCENEEVDIVHALFATPYAMWAYYTGGKYIITTRGSDVMHVLPELKKTGRKKVYLLILYKIFKKAFINAAFITSTSAGQAEKIHEMFGARKIEIVRTGVDVDFISKEIVRNDLPQQLWNCDYINSPRWIGELYNSKTQAYAILLLDDSILEKYTFVFYNNNTATKKYVQEFESLLKGNKKIKYIIFERLTQRQALACTKFAAVNFMIPERDGTPNSALEAMAASSPLIIGDFDYDIDLFDGTCIRLNENSPDVLAITISKTLISYPEAYLENAFKVVSKLGNRHVEMNKIIMLYEIVYQQIGKE